MIVTEDNVGQYYPGYAFNHPLFTEGMRLVGDSKVSRFLSSVTKDQIFGFLDDWNEDKDHQAKVYISYDSTNKNSQAGDLNIVEYGKPKDDKGLPVFNLSLVFDQNNRVPLFYEEYPGSVTDVAQLKYVIDKVTAYGYKRMGFILDRGYFSRENIRCLDEKKCPFVMMVKGCKQLVSSIIKEHRHRFESKRDCFISAYHVYGTSVKAAIPGMEKEHLRYFHLYFSSGKPGRLRRQRYRQLAENAENPWPDLRT